MNIQWQSCVPGSTSWPCPGLKPNSTELRDVVAERELEQVQSGWKDVLFIKREDEGGVGKEEEEEDG